MSQITTLTNHRSPQNQPHYFIRTHHLNRRPLCWSHQNTGSINQDCHKRFYRHMFFWFKYFFTFETSATASCGYMLYMAWGRLPGTTRKSHNYYQRTAPAIPALASPWDKFDLALVFMMGEFLSLGGTNCHSKIRDQLFHASKSKTTTFL